MADAKESADTNSQNMLFKIAGKIAQEFLSIGPQLAESYMKQWDKGTKFMSNETWNKWLDDLAKPGGFVDQDTADLMKELQKLPFPWGGIFMMLTWVKVKMGYFGSIMDIYTLDAQYDAQAKTTPHPAPVEALVRSMIVDPARATENRAKLKEHGFDDLQIDNIILSHYTMVPVNEIRTNFLRGNITETILYERMRELGFTDLRTAEIIQTWSIIPGPQDLFHMVAKEAFEPEFITKIGLGDEFPEDQVEWLEKQGINRFWAQKYWFAHWDQPSIGQGYEMLHRDIIDPSELDMLFKAVEIPPFWRDKLTQMAYRPYTRVDVRRMHDKGILDVDGVYRAYKDLGYDPEKANNMTRFTVEFNADNDKQLTKGSILGMYQDDLLGKSDTIDLLLSLDYSQDLIDLYILQADFDRIRNTQKILIENLKDRYLLGLSSEATTRDSLNKSGVRAEKIDALFAAWSLDQYKYQALPSRSDIDAFLIKGIISRDQWNQVMTRHGFQANHILWIFEELKPAIATGGRGLTKANLKDLFKENIILEPEWRAEMALLGYKPRIINLLFKIL